MLNVAVALGAHLAEAVVEAEPVAEEGGLVADHHLEVVAHIPVADICITTIMPVEDIIVLLDLIGAENPKV